MRVLILLIAGLAVQALPAAAQRTTTQPKLQQPTTRFATPPRTVIRTQPVVTRPPTIVPPVNGGGLISDRGYGFRR